MSVDGDVSASATVEIVARYGLTGTFTIGGDLEGTFQINHGTLDLFDEPRLTIEGQIVYGGDVYIPQALSGNVQIEVLGGIAEGGYVALQNTLDTGGLLQVEVPAGSSIDGVVLVDGDASGTLEVIGEVAAAGLLHVYGDLPQGGVIRVAGSPLAGTVDVDEDVEGLIHLDALTGKIDVAGRLGANPPTGLSGCIRIDGSFKKVGVDDPALVWIHTLYDEQTRTIIGPKAYFCVDFDGWDDGHDWGATARFAVGSDPNDPNNAYGPNSGYHIWHVTSCKGDMNNDGSVGMSDVTPFTTALNDVIYGTSNYAAAFPGLGATGSSMTYHGDANCDGTFNSSDVNPFVARVTSGDCDCEEGDAPGQTWAVMDSMTAEEVAALLAESIDPEECDGLVAIVAAAIDAAPDEEHAEFWEAVYAILTQ